MFGTRALMLSPNLRNKYGVQIDNGRVLDALDEVPNPPSLCQSAAKAFAFAVAAVDSSATIVSNTLDSTGH